MKIIRRSGADWDGSVPAGTGSMRLGRDGRSLPFTLKSRTEDGLGTNPEEMLGAAHAGCFSMSLCDLLDANGTPGSVHTESKLTMEEVGGSFSITRIELTVTGTVDGVEADTVCLTRSQGQGDLHGFPGTRHRRDHRGRHALLTVTAPAGRYDGRAGSVASSGSSA